MIFYLKYTDYQFFSINKYRYFVIIILLFNYVHTEKNELLIFLFKFQNFLIQFTDQEGSCSSATQRSG